MLARTVPTKDDPYVYLCDVISVALSHPLVDGVSKSSQTLRQITKFLEF